MIWNMLITGIGGQGVITASGLLRWAVLGAGFHLTGQDNRGGAQRLGHVSAVVRFTDEPGLLLAPEIPPRDCGLLISLEGSEGLRFAPSLGPQTVIVHSPRIVVPTNQRRARLPYVTLEECRAAYAQASRHVRMLDFDALARQTFGKPVLGNLVALGCGLALAGPPPLLAFLEDGLDGESLEAFRLGLAAAKETDA